MEYDTLDTVDDSAALDSYVAATMGELGCRVDSKVTKIVQKGVEHCRVPDVISYLGLSACFLLHSTQSEILIERAHLDPGYASIPSGPSNALSTVDSPYAKLMDIMSACLLPAAADYNLHLSVLFKGARGIGKRTVAYWVAQKLGIHLLEVGWPFNALKLGVLTHLSCTGQLLRCSRGHRCQNGRDPPRAIRKSSELLSVHISPPAYRRPSKDFSTARKRSRCASSLFTS